MTTMNDEPRKQDKKSFRIQDWPAATKIVAAIGVFIVIIMVAREAWWSEPELLTPASPSGTPEMTVSVSSPATLATPTAASEMASPAPTTASQAPSIEAPVRVKKRVVHKPVAPPVADTT